ncbi:MAG: ATP-binding protein [Acidobacteriota bacterium]|nr:ATP-binding protein [Acidobacteriota bacterium]
MSRSSRSRPRLNTDRLLLLGVAILVLVVSAIYFFLQKTEDFSWPYLTNSVLLSFLGITNAILILTFLFILFRNLIKLLVERKRNILGAKFKTKVVFTLLALWLLPSLLIFLAALHLIQSSVDKWFSTPVDEVTQYSQEVVDAYYDDVRQRAAHFAQRTSRLAAENGLLGENRRYLGRWLKRRLKQYGLDFIGVYVGGGEPLVVLDPRIPVDSIEQLPQNLIDKALAGEPFGWINSHSGSQLVRYGVPIASLKPGEPAQGVLVAGYRVSRDLMGLTSRISRASENYRQNKAQKSNIQRLYTFAFALVTLIILFSVTWIGLYLSKRITVPIQMLAHGTREISSGNLNYKVEVEAGDELGILVDSFNAMTEELRGNRETIDQRSRELNEINQALEERRRYIEILLENITTGVISLDRQGRVSTINRAAHRILGLPRRGAILNKPAEILQQGSADLKGLGEAIESVQSGAKTSLERELRFVSGGRTVTAAAHLSQLDDGQGSYLGMLIVLEDLTDLIKGQRLAAWREVAHRIAHEIKNPLTPIQLSAERIRKKWREKSPRLGEIVEEGSASIVREVNSLKSLVDAFTRFAQMPHVQPVPVDLGLVIDEALAHYNGRSTDLSIVRRDNGETPAVHVDPEQMRRVFINLIDNAIEAMNGQGQVLIGTCYLKDPRVVRVEVSDTGPGIPPEDRERLFMPYFSTKNRGTGLGLAIVDRIISDHNGAIHVRANVPQGTTFVIDLPVQG